MGGNRISIDFLASAQAQGATRRDAAPRASFGKRVIARVKADKFDRMLAVGVPAPARKCTRLHAARLTSVDEREAIARSLRSTVDDARNRDALIVGPDLVERAQHHGRARIESTKSPCGCTRHGR